MKAVVDVNKLINWFSTKKDQKSEFMCSVCGSICTRNIEEEFDNLTFNSGKIPNPTSRFNELEVGLVWTCSDRCKVTYTLQRA